MAPLHYPDDSMTSTATRLFRISGRGVPRTLIAAYLQVKSACARANRECGTLGSGQRNALLRAIGWIREHEGLWPELFPIDRFQAGAGTTLNMNVNEAIALVARRRFRTVLHPNDDVNRSQSTNDSYPTALRLALLAAIPELARGLGALRRSFRAKSLEFARIPKAGRTHLQDAVPMRLGEQFGAYVRTLEKLEARIEDARSGLLEMPLGGTAVGNGVAAPKGFRLAALRHLRSETGIHDLRTPRDPFEVQASALDFLALGHGLASIAIELHRVASDLRLQASGPLTGIHELELPKLVPGSSIMPGKTNPSGLELLHQVLVEALGVHATTLWSASMGQLELNVMLPAIAPGMIDSVETLARALEFVTERVIRPLAPCRDELERHWKSTEQWATLLSPEWGYDRVAEWVRLSRLAKRPFLEWVEKNQGIHVALSSRVSDAPMTTASGPSATSRSAVSRAKRARRTKPKGRGRARTKKR